MTLFLVAVFVLVAGALVYDRLPPTVPAAAGSTAVAHATPNADASLASDCMDAIDGAAVSPPSWAHLCWQAYRLTNEADAEKDYYVLRFFGSFECFRWLRLRTDLAGEPAGGAYDAWPRGTFDGDCREVTVDLMPVTDPLPPEEVCGRTASAFDSHGWTHQVTWTCERCLLPDSSTRAISLYDAVGVPQGTVPTWDLFTAAGP